MLPRIVILLVLAIGTRAQAADKVTYEKDVKPILREHCFACHNQDDATADLALDSFDGVTTGGAGGEVLSAGDPDGSRLWKLVTHQEEPKMPPGDKLPQAQLDTLKAWIEGGLLNDASSKPLERAKPAIAQIDPAKLGKPTGAPAMPEQLYHEPVLWTAKTGPVEALAASPWAPLVAVGWQRQISLYHTDTHELLGIVPYVDGVPKVVRFSRDGSLVLVAGGRHAAAGSAALFDVKTGARLATIGDELDIVLAADISPDLSLVALGGPKKVVRVYRVANGELVYQIKKHTDWITAIGFSPDGRWLATADRIGGALVWQAAAGHERADLRGHKASITSLDWRADSANLATASEDGTVRLWNAKGASIKSIGAHNRGVLSVRFAQDGNFVTAGRDRHVKTWKPDGAALTDLGKLPSISLAAAFTHDGKRVLASDYTGEVRLIDATNAKSFVKLSANPQPLATRLASANKAVGKAQRSVESHATKAKTLLAELEQGKAAHEAHANKLAKAQSALSESRKRYDAAANTVLAHQRKQIEAGTVVESAAAKLTEIRAQFDEAMAQSLEKEEADENDENSDAIAALRAQIEAATAAHSAAKQKHDALDQSLTALDVKQRSAERDVQSAETLVATVTNETAGLPDLEKLTAQHEQSKADLAAANAQLSSAKQSKSRLVAEQARFAAAATHLADRLQQQMTKQQELAHQSGRLEAEHQQSAGQLAAHQQQLSAVAEQLDALRAKVAELKATQIKLQQQADERAAALAKAQADLAASQQQVDQLEQSQRDLEAAETVRKKYSSEE